ncbi:MAG: hypothetical protein A3B70_05100 [Deltaproteobacteria bacterium RIFCSPHIGHO2_02_FULL_40_11]|nr:MAG: hypothetical protein A3B70_05100 [Deltaproteobacteria bacterium RIFCSPHIGHO2_02_FULL_40_11]
MKFQNSKVAIEISGLKKTYGTTHVLQGIDLKIQRGSFFGLLGPNGAGKTTTIHIICGLTLASGGRVQIFGKDHLTHYREARRAIGLSGQEYNLDRFFPLHKSLTYHGRLFGIPKLKLKNQIEKLLHQFGLHEHRNHKTHKLSGGLKRRMMMVKALLHDPEILILDEPTAGVDVELRIDLWNFLRKFNQEGKTIILTTHYLEEAENLCQEIAILSKGKIAICDTKENVIQQAKGNLMNYFITEKQSEGFNA